MQGSFERLGIYCRIARMLFWSLDRHFTENHGEFGIQHIRAHTTQLQELFNLKWGFSPGILFEEVHCSVCGEMRRLREDCGHINGEIYNGEICHDIVKKARLLHISLVDNPAQKYSVIWPDDVTQFMVLKLLAGELLSPWDAWTFKKEIRRRHHPVFRNAKRDAPCPCRSNLNYRSCCMKKDTVPQFPHYQFLFADRVRGQFPDLRVVHANL